MLTIADSIYPQRYEKLEAIIAAIRQGDSSPAELIAEAENRLPEIVSPPERLQTQLFLNALRSRVEGAAETENLYLVPDEGQQIKMFNFMAEKFPVVRHAQAIANHTFLSRVSADDCFTILDIGIGTGQQIAGLIGLLATRQSPVKRITVLGIEPSADSVAKAKARFRELADAHVVDVDFTCIQKTVEQLTPEDWDLLHGKMRETSGKLLINASFALHHVSPLSFRTELFAQLKALNPEAFIIIEPYADYTTDDLTARFRNAWHHYGLTFMAIDTIDALESEKSEVKHVFFGREMMDVLGEGNRVEQFETAEMWLDRLVRAGFSPMSVESMITGAFNPVMQIEPADSYLGFNVKGHPIVAVIGAC